MIELTTAEEHETLFERVARESREYAEKELETRRRADDERVDTAVRQIVLLMLENGGKLEEGSRLWKFMNNQS